MKQMITIVTLSILAIALSPWAAAHKVSESVSDQPLVAASLSLNRDRSAANKPHVFAMVLPARTGAKFSMLSISLQAKDPKAIPVPFNVRTAQAAVIQANGQQRAIAIQQTWIDETGTLWVEFKPSLPPKTRLTLSFNANQLPAKMVYEYGIAAYSDNEYASATLVDSGLVTVW